VVLIPVSFVTRVLPKSFTAMASRSMSFVFAACYLFSSMLTGVESYRQKQVMQEASERTCVWTEAGINAVAELKAQEILGSPAVGETVSTDQFAKLAEDGVLDPPDDEATADASSSGVSDLESDGYIKCSGGPASMIAREINIDDKLRDRSVLKESLAEGKQLVLDQAVQAKNAPPPPPPPPVSDFVNIGYGKCRSCGRDPRHVYKHGQGGSCEQMCRGDGNCCGYSVSKYSNCLLWYECGMLAPGGHAAEWGGAHCVVKKSKRSVPCPAVNCQGTWSSWSQCSATCGSGTQTQSFTVTTQAAHGGKACPNPSTRTQKCNEKPCPKPVVVDKLEEDDSPCR